ncbi:hypothetical protein H4W19_12720 [Pseudoxanthomonas mexicana]|uniref:Uncharacterized protein n=1 Tax=Pseudoxanthomonas mexicana TaxID=128785 RepID=A0ABX6R7K9_PSEMX|nr:hypothetical protein [Pseudoxanthomonas mexicana]QND79218.1 hypothetical protein H4W19_12720 [Pseudoxanthomonas mexicana]
MKRLCLAAFALLPLLVAFNASAGSLIKGRDNRGVRLDYESLSMGGSGAVRFSLECVKNWGGQVGGVATVVAYYLDGAGEIREKSESVSCHVKGGLDGERRKRRGVAKSITIPVPLSQAEVRAYVDYEETSNIDDALEHLGNEVNKGIERVTSGEVRKPLSVGKTLEQAVAPAGGDKLAL